MDEKDRQLLALLDQYARESITQLARKTRINKEVARYRIRRLEEQGIISGYYTLINTHKLGLMTVRVYFRLNHTSKTIKEEIIRFLDKQIGAGQIFTRDGAYDVGIILWEPSIYTLEKKLRAIKQRYADHISSEQVSIFTTMHHHPRRYLQPRTAQTHTLKEETQTTIDNDDYALLHALSTNARASTVALAKHLSIPQRTVAYKMRRLEQKGIIMAYKAAIDIDKIGRENYYLEIRTDKNQSLTQLEAHAASMESCTYASLTLTDADIEIEIEVEGKQELLALIETMHEQFPHIKRIDYSSTIKYHKFDYLPGHIKTTTALHP